MAMEERNPRGSAGMVPGGDAFDALREGSRTIDPQFIAEVDANFIRSMRASAGLVSRVEVEDDQATEDGLPSSEKLYGPRDGALLEGCYLHGNCVVTHRTDAIAEVNRDYDGSADLDAYARASQE